MTRFLYDRGYNFNRGIPFANNVHGFVLNKAARIRAHLVKEGVAPRSAFESPGSIREGDLSAVHSDSVLDGLRSSRSIAAAAEFPPLAFLPLFVARHIIVKPQLRACAGTQLALSYAAAGEWAFNLSGGFHHARPELSHGFCLVNDVAWAVHTLRRTGSRARVLVLDLDLHQGDGSAAAFEADDAVFTASLHQGDTFPIPKLKSDIDVELSGGGISDERYLGEVDALLVEIRRRFEPEIIIYVAGTDPYHADAIGDFELSADGIVERDRRVARFAHKLNAGLVALPAGGYSPASPELSGAGFAAMIEVARKSKKSPG